MSSDRTRFEIVDFHCHHVPARFFIDPQFVHPALIRASVDLLAADHVLAGSDWPIVDGPFARKFREAMQQAGFSGHEQQAIAAGNCLKLLGIG